VEVGGVCCGGVEAGEGEGEGLEVRGEEDADLGEVIGERGLGCC